MLLTELEIRISSNENTGQQLITTINLLQLTPLDIDYAMFQRGFSFRFGWQTPKRTWNPTKAHQELSSIEIISMMLFLEIAESNQNLKQYDEAIKYYKKIENDYAGSSYHVKALVQLGLIYFNQDKPDSSAVYYKRVVEEYPGSSEAKKCFGWYQKHICW